MIPADNNATVSEEVRKLAELIVNGDGLPKEWWDEHDDRKAKDIEIEWTAQLLSDALRKERELVLEEAADICDTWDSAALAATMIRALAAKGASHE